MEQREVERFRVIGACTKMQTISLEDEWKLMDGIPYQINFFQDFSGMFDKEPALIVEVQIEIEPRAKTNERYVYPKEQRTQEIFKHADKYVKKERKREEKWKEKRKRKYGSKKERQCAAELFLENIDCWINSK